VRVIQIIKKVGLVVITLKILAGVNLLFPNIFLKPLLESYAERHIPGRLTVGNLSIGWDDVTLSNVRYDNTQKAPLTISKASLVYAWKGLTPTTTALNLQGVAAHAAYTDSQGLELKGLPPLPSASNDGDSFPLTLQDITLAFDTPYGVSQLIWKGHLTLAKTIDAKGDMEFTSPLATLKGMAHIEGSVDHLKAIIDIENLGLPHLFNLPVAGKATILSTPQNVTLSTSIQNASIGLEADIQGSYDFAKKTSLGKASYKVNDLKAALKASTQPVKLPLTEMAGGISGEATLSYTNDKLHSSGMVKLLNMKLSQGEYHARKINGTLVFQDLQSFVTAPHQVLTIKELQAGIPFQDVKIDFERKADGTLTINKSQAKLGAGTISTSGFTFTFLDKPTSVVVSLESVPAQLIMNTLKIADLSVSGLVDAKVTVGFTDKDFEIAKGSKAWIQTPPGTIKYRPAMSQGLTHTTQTIKGDEPPMDLLLIALWNFHYEDLKVSFHKEFANELEAVVYLKGRNPDAFSGHPFEVNINLSGETLKAVSETFKMLK